MRKVTAASLEQCIRSLVGGNPLSIGQSWVFNCPRCIAAGRKGKEKIHIRKHDGRWGCFVCRHMDLDDKYEGYNVWRVLSHIFGVPEQEIREQLTGGSGDVSPSEYVRQAEIDPFQEAVEMPSPAVEWPVDAVTIDHPSAAPGAAYLALRGISLEIAKEYGCRYRAAQQRVLFPIANRSTLYGWQGRIIHNSSDQPKAISSKDLRRDRVVMFWDRLRKTKHALVAEGPISAIKGHYVGGNVATLGKFVSNQQLRIVEEYATKLYIGLDPDAFREADNIRSRTHLPCYRLDIPPSQDLGDLTFQDVEDLVSRAKPWNDNTLFFFLGASI